MGKKFTVKELECTVSDNLPFLFDVNGLSFLLGVQLKTLTWLTSSFGEERDPLSGEIIRDEN